MHIIHCSTPHCIPSYFPAVTELRSSIMPRLVLQDCCSHVCSPDHKWWRTFPSLNFLPFAIPTLSYATLSVPHVEVMWETTAREIRSLSTGWSVKEPKCAQPPPNSLIVTNSASHSDCCTEVQFYSYSRSKILV